MPDRPVAIILPASTLDALPTDLCGDAAAEIISAWTIGWHPALLHASGKVPQWHESGTDLQELAGAILLLPQASRNAAPAGWISQLESDRFGGGVIEQLADRAFTLPRLLELMPDAAASVQEQSLLSEIAEDFYALALALLVVELVGHTMHYSSNVDRDALERAALAAAEHARNGQKEEADERLQRCFDLLAEARDYYYPVDSYMIDVSLVADTVWGEPLRRRLRTGPAVNLMISAQQLESIAADAPESVETIRGMVDDEQCTIVGGDLNEQPQSPQSLESLLDQLLAARSIYQRLLSRTPVVFGRMSTGWSPMLPCLLEGLGFDGAVLASFDGSRLPDADQCRFRWEGPDGASVNALSTTPCDASDPGTLLRLAKVQSRSMERDHVSTVLLASWPGHESPYYHDLIRAAERTTALGRFVTLGQYFDLTHGADMPTSLSVDSFLPAAQAEATLPAASSPAPQRRQRERAQLLTGLTDVITETKSINTSLERRALDRIATLIMPHGSGHQSGELVVNLASQPRTIAYSHDSPADDTTSPPVADRLAHQVPAMGFVCHADGNVQQPNKPLAKGLTLRNELLAVTINPRTGGIEAVHDTAHRRNRISQQIALKDFSQSPDRDAGSGYTKMLADESVVTDNDAVAAEITSRGRLVASQQKVVARFEQITRLQRTSRIVDVRVTLSEFGGETEQSRPPHALLRWAWRDPPLEIRRDLHGASFVTSRKSILAPDFLELVETDGRLAILSGGNPWHRRACENRLDTILPIGSAGHTTFNLAVVIDPPGPSANELDAWSLPPLTTSVEHLAQDVRAWWLYCRSRNVRFTHVAQLAGGRNGFTARLQEVRGSYVHTRLEAFRPIHAAHRTDLLGNHLVALPVHDGKAELQLAGYQWIQIDVEWQI